MEGMMLVRNPDHVTVAVADGAAAIQFFQLLGFRKQHVAAIDGGPPARYMGMPDMKAQLITLVLEGVEPRFEIQLLEFDPRPPDDPGEHPTNLRRRDYNHLAFRVDDIAAATRHLVATGVKMLSDEMDYISRRLRFFEAPRASPSNSWSGSTPAALSGSSLKSFLLAFCEMGIRQNFLRAWNRKFNAG
jgi:catechol 2,3-dioxygenase-like lactoylglutathione lyase family enzyme